MSITPVTRNFYSYAIFFNGLTAAIAFFQSIIYFRLGSQFYSLESFPAWYLSGNFALLVGTLFLLKYYHLKQYLLPFWIGVVSTITGIFQTIVVYGILMGMRSLGVYYIPVVLSVLAVAVVYSLSLIFSNAAERPWLKVTGIISLVLALILSATIIWSMGPPDIQRNAMVEEIHQWASLISGLIPVLLVINFFDERKILGKQRFDSPPAPHRSFEMAMPIVSAVAFMATLFLGSFVLKDTISKISWDRKLSYKAKEWEQIFESRTFVGTGGDTLKYQLLKPAFNNLEGKYPLVVCLPFGGGVEGSPPAQYLLTEANQRKHPSFLFVPFCPEGKGWGGIPHYPTIDTLVFEAIQSLEREFSEIDVKKCYVTGVSRGGYGSWHFITTRPDMFAAAIPICGEGNPNLAANIIDVGVWAFHGEHDRNVPVEGSRDMIAAIKDAGGDPRYTEFKGAGHNIWEDVKGTSGVLDWLFAQERN